MSELKPEAILTFLGFEADKVKTEEDFKTQFESKFGIKEALLKDPTFTSKIFGQRVGSIEAKVKANAKKMGVEFLPDEIKDKQVEDILELSFTKIAENFKKATEDAEKASKGTVDEQVKTWKEKYGQLEGKFKDNEILLNKTSAEYDGFKKEQVNKSKFDTINGFKKSAISKLEFKQDISAVEKVGFESLLNSKYDFDLDENQNPYIKDKTTGARIPSKKVTGQHMSADEVLQEELISNKLAKINPNGGKTVAKTTTHITSAEQPAATTLYIHPNALRDAELGAVKVRG